MKSYIDRQMAQHRAVQAQNYNLVPNHLLDQRISMTVFNPPVRKAQNYGAPTVQDQLYKSGIGQIEAELASGFAWILPRSSDADQPGIKAFVRAIQYQLEVPQSGYLDSRTVAALERISGPGWFDKTWTAILGDAITKGGHASSPRRLPSLGATPEELEKASDKKAGYILLGAILITSFVMLK